MNLSANKENAIAFYKMAYEGNPRKGVELYVGDDYIQHNPLVGDGKEPFIIYFERMQVEYPEKSIEFVRTIAEGDLSSPAYTSSLARESRICDHGFFQV